MTDIIESDPSLATAEPRPERQPWALLAALIALALAIQPVATWLDISRVDDGFADLNGLAFVIRSSTFYGAIGLLAQVACAGIARGATRRLAAAICEVTALALVAASVAGLVLGEDENLSGGVWSTRATYLMTLVIAAAIGAVAIRMTHDR